MVEDIFVGVLKFITYLFRDLFIEIVCFYTGEVLLSLLTLGFRKPKWNFHVDKNASKFVIFTEISVWVGFIFWLSMIVIFINFIFV